MEWQPIETAPMHGTFLIFVAPHIVSASRFRMAWMSRGESLTPTHWMPLPEPPK